MHSPDRWRYQSVIAILEVYSGLRRRLAPSVAERDSGLAGRASPRATDRPRRAVAWTRSALLVTRCRAILALPVCARQGVPRSAHSVFCSSGRVSAGVPRILRLPRESRIRAGTTIDARAV